MGAYNSFRLAIISAALAVSALAADPALVKLLPPGANAVGGINVDQGKNSPLGQYLLANITDERGGLQKLIETTGFDPRRDLRELVFASTDGRHNGFFAARGLFDQSRILTTARTNGNQVLVYQGFNVIAGKKADSQEWVTFLDSSTVVGGNADQVKAAIVQHNAKSVAQPYLAKIQELSSKYDAWLYTLQPANSLPQNLPNNQNTQIVRSITQLTGGVKLGANVVIDGQAIARSEKDATALQDVIRFLAGMVQLNRDKPNAEQIATLLDSLQVKTNADTVSVSLSIPETDLEKMIASGKQQRKRASRI